MKAFLKSAIAAGVMALMSFNIHAQNFTPVVSPVVHEDIEILGSYFKYMIEFRALTGYSVT